MTNSRTYRTTRLAVLAATLALTILAPAAASAAERHASPTGSGDACSFVDPCNIKDAVGEAKVAGDEVILHPGDYALTETLAEPQVGQPITIRGIPGQPRPRLLFSGPAQIGLRLNWGSTLRYVEVVQDGQASAIFADHGATIDQVIARTSGDGGIHTVNLLDGAVSNSIVVSNGADGTALAAEKGGGASSTSTARNVTAIATGSGGVPVLAWAATTADLSFHLTNVIAWAGPGAVSFKVMTDDSGAQAKLFASHTSYQSVKELGIQANFVADGTNRSEEPAFVDAAGGDYHQAPGAYTIDFGMNWDGVDVDGDPRAFGTTDIGADEWVPAPPSTPPAAGPDTTAPFAGVKLASTRLIFAHRAIIARLRSSSASPGRASGRITLTARNRRTRSAVVLGRARFSVSAGGVARIRIRVSRAGRRLLRRERRVSGKAVIAARSEAGQAKTNAARVTIRARRR